jgi:hypothetical protein
MTFQLLCKVLSGGRSVGIVHSRTQATEFVCFCFFIAHIVRVLHLMSIDLSIRLRTLERLVFLNKSSHMKLLYFDKFLVNTGCYFK